MANESAAYVTKESKLNNYFKPTMIVAMNKRKKSAATDSIQFITHHCEVTNRKVTDHRGCAYSGFQNQNKKYKCETVRTTKAHFVIEPTRSGNESSRWRRRSKVFVVVKFFVTPVPKLQRTPGHEKRQPHENEFAN